MGLQLISAATLTCVSLAEAKAQCRVDVADEDALLLGMIAAAQEDAETLMRRAVLTQRWRLTLDGFDACAPIISLRPVTVFSVESVKYVDANGTLQTLAPSEYQASLGGRLTARLAPAYGKSWPTARAQMDAVQIDFTAGWATAAAVPQVIKQWVLMRVAAYYDNREAWTQGHRIERNPFIDQMVRFWIVPAI